MALWKQRGFLTSAGHQIAHAAQVSNLLEAIQLPKVIAVIHCRAHQKDDSMATEGNLYADATAKWAATEPSPHDIIAPAIRTEPVIPYRDFLEKGEAELWEKKLGAVFKEGFWRVPDGSP